MIPVTLRNRALEIGFQEVGIADPLLFPSAPSYSLAWSIRPAAKVHWRPGEVFFPIARINELAPRQPGQTVLSVRSYQNPFKPDQEAVLISLRQ